MPFNYQIDFLLINKSTKIISSIRNVMLYIKFNNLEGSLSFLLFPNFSLFNTIIYIIISRNRQSKENSQYHIEIINKEVAKDKLTESIIILLKKERHKIFTSDRPIDSKQL